MSTFFVELSLVMILAFVLSFLANKIKQPLLIGYILTGLIAGPIFLNILGSTEGYKTFSHIGIALLLFIVGLHLNLKLIKELGIVAALCGAGQIFFTALIGYFIGIALGFEVFTSFLIGIAISFSSTIVIVKLLTDRRELEKVQGKLSLGILIIQDLVAVIFLIALTSLKDPASKTNIIFSLGEVFLYGFLAFIAVLIFSKLVLEKLLKSIAKSQELLYIFVIAWCLGISSFFSSLGFSVEIGALVAGIALASSPFQYEISSKIKPLRDFFIVMFFILLGAQMVPVTETLDGNQFQYLYDNFSEIFFSALIFSLFVLVGKPLIIFILLNMFKFHSKVSFASAIHLAQISEFSLIVLLLAQTSGLVDSQTISMITLIVIITITISTYMVTNTQKLYNFLRPIIKKLESENVRKNEKKKTSRNQKILIFGYDRISFNLLNQIKQLKKDYLVIDYNPIAISKLKSEKIPSIYGDASNSDFISEFNFETVELLISTIPDYETNMILLKEFKKRNKLAPKILTSDTIENALGLYREGADYVIIPHYLGSDYVSLLLEKHQNDISSLLNEKIKHMNELKSRKEFGKRSQI